MLSKEERARKFASKSPQIGLRSRGSRKLTLSEQEALFADLSSQPPQTRLENLRILRESISSGSVPLHLKNRVYEASVAESIRQHQFEPVPFLLTHLGSTTPEFPTNQLFIVSMANTNQFHQALARCQEPRDFWYVSSVATQNEPLWRHLNETEPSLLVKTLMNQLSPRFTAQKRDLAYTLRHPSTVKST